MFHRILVPTDGSPHAERALAEAGDLAKLADASLTVMTAVPESSTWLLGGASGGFVPPVSPHEVDAQIKREYEGMLDAAVASVPADVETEKVLAHGSPAAAILEQVTAGSHDLIAMGSRGLGGMSSLLLGSVSHDILQTSPVPVLVFRGDAG